MMKKKSFEAEGRRTLWFFVWGESRLSQSINDKNAVRLVTLKETQLIWYTVFFSISKLGSDNRRSRDPCTISLPSSWNKKNFDDFPSNLSPSLSNHNKSCILALGWDWDQK